MVIPPFNRESFWWVYIYIYIYKTLLLGGWVYPLLYGNNGSLDPSINGGPTIESSHFPFQSFLQTSSDLMRWFCMGGKKPGSKCSLKRETPPNHSFSNTLLKQMIFCNNFEETSIFRRKITTVHQPFFGGKVCGVFIIGSILHPNPKNSQGKPFNSLPWPMIKRLDIFWFLEVVVILGTLQKTNISHLGKGKPSTQKCLGKRIS